MSEQLAIKNPTLPTPIKERIIYKALLTRRVEEQLLELFGLGELHGTVHTCIGQEFIGAVVSEFIMHGDAVFSNHRCHGHFLSVTQNVEGLIAEIYGKASGVCGGRGGSQHLHQPNFYSNGIQGGIVPIAAGLAMGKKLQNNQKVSFVFIGDGTLGEGVLYETLNIISKWNLPLIVILENNLYAQSTSQKEVMAGNILDRAQAFAIKTAHANTWDFEQLYWTVDELVTDTRTNLNPVFLQIDTYRLSSHSKGDDNRDNIEVDYYKSIDPLNLILASSQYDALLIKINQLIAEALTNTKKAPVASAYGPLLTPLIWSASAEQQNMRLGSALNETFKELMQSNEHIFFIGEDVRSPYGGAFKISKDLSDLFPERVLNTPISEAALVGLANGLALEGYRPIVEIMFGDFISLAFDQIINHAAKFRYMYNNQVRVPLIIRTPMGGGRGYGPTHSQNLERHLVGIPGIRVLALNNLIHPKIIYETLINSSEDPAIVLENKVLYTKNLRPLPPAGFSYRFINESCPMIIVEPQASHPDLTIVAYGGLSDMMIEIIEELFLEHELIVQYICPLQIYPFDVQACHQFISLSNYVVLIEEGQGFANFSSEFVAQYSTLYPKNPLHFIRLAADATPIPSSKLMENEALVSKEKIIQSIFSLLHVNQC